MPTLRKIFPLILGLSLPALCLADQATVEQAEKLYQSGEWDKARLAYRTELSAVSGTLPAAFFYNYGTAAAKAGAVGEAYVALMRSALSHPFDADARFNLKIVEKQVSAAALSIRPALWFPWWPSVLRSFPWQLWALVALLSSILALWQLGTAGRGFPLQSTAVAVLLYLLAGASWAQERLPVYGVIQASKVKSGPGATFSDITTLEPGSLINQEAIRDGWLKIRFSKLEADVETVGWLEPGTVLEVRRN